ncbi:MAG: hypothetical protein NT119_10375 [Actinobacteria bacterium]|nr:hypothetical protein [Actinomycetota bacterium]
MTAAPNPPNPSELIDKFISQLPDKIKLWRFVGKMAVEQVNKRFIDQVDNYSTREPSNPPVVPKSDKLVVASSDEIQIKTAKMMDKVQPKAKKTPPSTASKLPIAGYDDLSALQILDLLGGLDKAELTKIKKYETANRSRQTILKKIALLSDASK